MNTYFGLLAEFNGRAELPLEEVAPRYFGISARTTGMRAGARPCRCPRTAPATHKRYRGW
ncbi:hypothetical protein [Chromohalobacter israelensis]|uniref:hypothetical protein n=1 Tax=Chromohalobacter israelensis TaxID=141390 RepID=UPI0005BABA15|nr:hypothetical protein [Chromohalobacter salexigens]